MANVLPLVIAIKNIARAVSSLSATQGLVNDSGGRMMMKQLITVGLQRRVGVESLARAVVDLICNRIELLLAIAREVRTFG